MQLDPLLTALLCGGGSRRMGIDKARLQHPEGGTLLERAVALATSQSGEVLLLSGDGRRYPELGLPQLADALPGAGPLGGLVAALRGLDAGALLLLPIDLPVLRPIDLTRMLSAARATLRPAVTAAAAGRLHPLPSIWSVECLATAESALASGRLALHDLLADLGAERVELPEPTLINWNRAEDWSG